MGLASVNLVHIAELFSLSFTVDMLYAEICRSRRFFKGKWVALSANFRRKGCHPPTAVGVRKLYCPWYQTVCSALFGFATKHACDRQTGRQSYGALPKDYKFYLETYRFVCKLNFHVQIYSLVLYYSRIANKKNRMIRFLTVISH